MHQEGRLRPSLHQYHLIRFNHIRKLMDFTKMTTRQLRAYAREHYSTISKLTRRADLIAALTAAQQKRN